MKKPKPYPVDDSEKSETPKDLAVSDFVLDFPNKQYAEKPLLVHSEASQTEPLTKRVLARAAKKAAAENEIAAMKIMGYLVVAQDGWVIKKYADGSTEKIKKIAFVDA